MKKFKFSADCSKSPEKKDVNKVYRDLVKKYGCVDGNHLILDSRFKNTIKSLNHIKIPSSRIYVPNPFEEIKTENWSDQTVGEFLLGNVSRAFTSVYLDYCCTLYGNEHMHPLKDIRTLIRNEMIDGVFGIELSGRDAGGKEKKWQDIFKLINTVEELAIENGYIYEVLDGWVYKQMFVVFFYLKQ